MSEEKKGDGAMEETGPAVRLWCDAATWRGLHGACIRAVQSKTGGGWHPGHYDSAWLIVEGDHVWVVALHSGGATTRWRIEDLVSMDWSEDLLEVSAVRLGETASIYAVPCHVALLGEQEIRECRSCGRQRLCTWMAFGHDDRKPQWWCSDCEADHSGL